MKARRFGSFVACVFGGPMLACPAFGQGSVPVDNSAGPHICWLDKVLIERSGVRLLFLPSDYHILGGLKSQGRFVVGHHEITWLSGPKEHNTEPGLFLVKNEIVFLTQGVEDNCDISFAQVRARVGIIAHATFSLPGLPRREAKLFIPGR